MACTSFLVATKISWRPGEYAKLNLASLFQIVVFLQSEKSISSEYSKRYTSKCFTSIASSLKGRISIKEPFLPRVVLAGVLTAAGN